MGGSVATARRYSTLPRRPKATSHASRRNLPTAEAIVTLAHTLTNIRYADLAVRLSSPRNILAINPAVPTPAESNAYSEPVMATERQTQVLQGRFWFDCPYPETRQRFF